MSQGIQEKQQIGSKLQEIGWRLGLRPRPCWGNLQRSPRPPGLPRTPPPPPPPPPPPFHSQIPRSAGTVGSQISVVQSMHACATITKKLVHLCNCKNENLRTKYIIWRNGPYIGGHLAFFFKLNFKHVYNLR